MEKEKWIDEVLKSAEGMNPAGASPFLHTRIMARLEKQSALIISRRLVYALVTCFVVLLTVNILVWNRSAQSVDVTTQMQESSNDYDLSTIDY